MSNSNDLIRDLISFIKLSYVLPSSLKLKFNELDPKINSICLAHNVDTPTVETKKDVCGYSIHGEMTLYIFYRVVGITHGIDDLDAVKVIDDLMEHIKSKYKSTLNEIWVVKMSTTSNGVLSQVYSGNIRDYKGIFQVSYERMV